MHLNQQFVLRRRNSVPASGGRTSPSIEEHTLAKIEDVQAASFLGGYRLAAD